MGEFAYSQEGEKGITISYTAGGKDANTGERLRPSSLAYAFPERRHIPQGPALT